MNTPAPKVRKWPEDYSLFELLDELGDAQYAVGFHEGEDKQVNEFSRERRAIADKRLTDLLSAIKSLFVWSRPESLRRVLYLYHGDKINVNDQESLSPGNPGPRPDGYGIRPDPA